MNCGERIKEKEIIAVIQQLTELQLDAKKISGLDGIRTRDLSDSHANALPLSYKARWELDIFHIQPLDIMP